MSLPSFAQIPRVFRAAVAAACGVAFLAFGATSSGVAQEGAIAGTVTDAQTLEPLEGAQVFIPGAGIGALTDASGAYRLTGVPAGQVEVQVQLLGHRQAVRTVSVQAGQVTTADFEIAVSAIRLEDVVVNVVTGLERRKRELGTNVTSINTDRVNKGAISNVDQFLAGRAEGVILQFNSGDVHAKSSIRIRGSNSLNLSNEPLIFVDGIQVTNSAFAGTDSGAGFGSVALTDQPPSRLNDLNPEDIANIEVVKGPAASALYGAVGANGVLLITTKRGQAGRTDWHLYAEGGPQEDHSRWPLNFTAATLLPGSDPSAPLFTEAGFNTDDYALCPALFAGLGLCVPDTFSTFNSLKDPRTTPFSTGDIQTYGGSVAGGSEVATYFVSGEVNFSESAVRFNKDDRVNTRVNLDAGVLDNLNASLSIGYQDRSTDFVSNDNSIFSPILNGVCGTGGFVPGGASTSGPAGPPNDGPNRANFCFGRNLQDLEEASVSFENIQRFTGSGNVNWQPLSWLRAQGNFGLDLLDQATKNPIQPGVDNLASVWTIGTVLNDRASRQNWTANASASASFDITDAIRSTTTAGGSFQEELLETTFCGGSGIPSGLSSCASTTQLFQVDETFLNVVTLGAFGQQEFAIGDRLFVTGSVRLDDNSNFGGLVGTEIYPAANVSYVMSEEEWFPTGSFLTEFRLRGGYGEAGVRPGFRDAVTQFSIVTVRAGGEDLQGVTLSESGNEGLKAERVREFEGGFDLGLVNDRLGLQFTYFNKESEDALIRRQLQPSLGLTPDILANLGSIRNQGTELSLRAEALDRRDVRANFLVQFTTFDNEVEELGEGVEPITFGSSQRHQEGFPAGAYFDPPFTFEDTDGNGFLAGSEVTVSDVDCSEEGETCFLDESDPTWTASLTADIELFQFLRFSSLVDARGGNSLLDFTELFRCLRTFSVPGAGCEGQSSPSPTLADQARLLAFLDGSAAGYVESADFLKWREVSVTLTAPPSLARKHRLLERSSLTFSGRNLGLITNYGGIDPEINSFGGDNNFSQDEFNTQPPLRVFTARLDIRF